MKKHLFVLLACLFVVMIGFGITLPVLPFYVERLARGAGPSSQSIVLHVSLLTVVYALMQLIFAPLWSRWSDCIGSTASRSFNFDLQTLKEHKK